jgi:decaprenylphospho-beta-D-ribofuranose 2-oxidase
MGLMGMQVVLSNWSKSTCSSCFLYPAGDVQEIKKALHMARSQQLPVIAHGAGHSYTDAALNTSGVVIDITAMNRILSWDPEPGIMCVEPGVTLRQVIRVSLKDGWWPMVAPSTPDVTAAGCAAMNINGRNSWKYGPFGTHILALDLMTAGGEICRISPESDDSLFHAVMGSMGLLGIITAITLQLERIPSGKVIVRKHTAASLGEIFDQFEVEEKHSDYLEAWIDGFASKKQTGRGILTAASIDATQDKQSLQYTPAGIPGRVQVGLVNTAAFLGRAMITPGIRMASRINYQVGRFNPEKTGKQALFPFTFWPAFGFTAYHAFFPEGVETFQAFVPSQGAEDIFKEVLRFSQRQGFPSLWSIIKRHHSDPFLLSYQVDGFSLELNFQRTRHNAFRLQKMIELMIPMVIEGGGKFYLAKDHFLTSDQYRQSMGEKRIEAFLRTKKSLDPETRLQSDLFRRVFR